MRSNTKQALLVTLVGVTLFVALLRLSDVLAFAAQLVDLVLPILAGGILALFLSSAHGRAGKAAGGGCLPKRESSPRARRSTC